MAVHVLFMLAQWLEHWCASLVAQVRIMAVSFRVSYYNKFSCCLLTCLQDSWPEIVFEGFEPVTFGSKFRSEARRRAVGWGTPEFLGQLTALLLVAQWLERWCAV